MKDNHNDEMIRIMLIGDSAVGKSSIIGKFCDPSQPDNEIKPTTLGLDYFEKTMLIQNKKVLVQLWDTAGQEKYRSLIPSYYRSAMGILLVYSVEDRNSFNSV